MIQVQEFFDCFNPIQTCNEFLIDNNGKIEVIDIKYTSSSTDKYGDIRTGCLVIYKEKEEN